MNTDESKELFNTSGTIPISEENECCIEIETDNIELNLNKSIQKEVKFLIQDHRLSTGSNMSTSSIDSADTSMQNFSPSVSSNLVRTFSTDSDKILVRYSYELRSTRFEFDTVMDWNQRQISFK